MTDTTLDLDGMERREKLAAAGYTVHARRSHTGQAWDWTGPWSSAMTASLFDTEELAWDDAARSYITDVYKARRLLAPEIAEHKATKERLEACETALTEIDAIRNSIIGCQSVNWSEHIYPLVATLERAGFPGQSYETARANVGTLFEQINDASYRAVTAEAQRARAKEGLERLASLKPGDVVNATSQALAIHVRRVARSILKALDGAK
jgi:hypothetical protein